MRVRHKATGAKIMIRPHPQISPFFVTKGGSLIHMDDPEWEVVKEDEREDVTANYRHDLDGRTVATLLDDDEFKYIDGRHNGPAFIIERKKG